MSRAIFVLVFMCFSYFCRKISSDAKKIETRLRKVQKKELKEATCSLYVKLRLVDDCRGWAGKGIAED